jgi:hypothetical protein
MLFTTHCALMDAERSEMALRAVGLIDLATRASEFAARLAAEHDTLEQRACAALGVNVEGVWAMIVERQAETFADF